MLESIVDSRIIFYLMGTVTILGIVSKLVVGSTLNILVKAASIMPKSPHSFMKLVRAKFEHACMVNDHVENIEVFVDKYIHEYQVWGIRLYGWQRLEKVMVTLLALLTIISGGLTYYVQGFGEVFLQKTGVGVAMLVLLLAIYQMSDEAFKLETMRIYMMDYLENVCARRYRKDQGRKEKVVIPDMERKIYGKEEILEIREEEMDASRKLDEQMESISAKKKIREVLSPMPKEPDDKEEEYMPNEAAIREILQEFMA